MESIRTVSGRQNARFGSVFWGPVVRLLDGNRTLTATVLDESLGGLGLHVNGKVEFQPGQTVFVATDFLRRRARLVHAVYLDKSKMRVGIAWIPDADFVAGTV